MASEKPGATAALLGQATVLKDRIGLNPNSMRFLLWQIAEPADAVALPGGLQAVHPAGLRNRLRPVVRDEDDARDAVD
jgi:hypothetical protein